MLSDTSMRPAGALAHAVAVPTSDRTAADTAVRTELPPRQAVTAIAAAPRNEPTLPNTRAVSHQVVIDSAAASLVFQEVDQRTSQVVKQYPEQTALRRRAYIRELEAKQAEEVMQKIERDHEGFEATV